MALRGRRSNNFVELWCLSSGFRRFGHLSFMNFQKSNICWPLQAPLEKVLKSVKINWIFDNLIIVYRY